MKFLYLLQTIRDMSLGYHFRLYTYGPFDSDVLSDLGLAERLGAVDSELLQYSGGHRYELHEGANAEEIIANGCDYLTKHKDDIDWVYRLFARRSARDLENASTLIFIDRSASGQDQQLSLADLVQKVHEVKPHLPKDLIQKEARDLKELGLIEAQ